AVGAWVAADHYATRMVVDGLEDRGLSDLLEVERVRLPLPGLLRATGVSLRDPRTGQIVAHLDQVEAHFAGGGLGALQHPMPDWVVGRGGGLTLARTHGDLSIVRAVDALLQRLKPPPAPPAPEAPAPPPPPPEEAPPAEAPRLPRIEFRDVEV